MPEQASRVLPVTPATDVFAVGYASPAFDRQVSYVPKTVRRFPRYAVCPGGPRNGTRDFSNLDTLVLRVDEPRRRFARPLNSSRP